MQQKPLRRPPCKTRKTVVVAAALQKSVGWVWVMRAVVVLDLHVSSLTMQSCLVCWVVQCFCVKQTKAPEHQIPTHQLKHTECQNEINFFLGCEIFQDLKITNKCFISNLDARLCWHGFVGSHVSGNVSSVGRHVWTSLIIWRPRVRPPHVAQCKLQVSSFTFCSLDLLLLCPSLCACLYFFNKCCLLRLMRDTDCSTRKLWKLWKLSVCKQPCCRRQLISIAGRQTSPNRWCSDRWCLLGCIRYLNKAKNAVRKHKVLSKTRNTYI